MFDQTSSREFDYWLLGAVFALCLLSSLAIFSAATSFNYPNSYFFKQLVWVVLGFISIAVLIFMDYRWIVKYSIFTYLFLILLLVLTLLIGTGESHSSVKRWLNFGFFYLQPSEFIKVNLALCLAYYFREPKRVGNPNLKILAVPFILTLVPFLLILKQPDLGTALSLWVVFFAVVFLVGLNKNYIISLAIAGVISLPVIWFAVLKPYQQERILTALNPESNPLGAGYHVLQSKIAIGSGGFWGKGFLQGGQSQLNFLPARHTDFIFSVFSEEWGFAGSLVVISLYVFIIFRILNHIPHCKSRIGVVLICGLISIIATQVLINLGMVVGFLPVVGMPLPFFSYGGSAMLSMMASMGLILNVKMYRKLV